MLNPESLQCPDCHGKVNADLLCLSCARQIALQAGFYNLLPRQLAENKQGEDTVFAPGSLEWKKFSQPWRKLIGRLEIVRFEHEILPALPVGNFLELAGESCWAAAIYKSTNPTATVWASDVSPNAITEVAIPLGKMFPHPPDYYASIDAESLPFVDNFFDCIFIEAAMHHMPNIVAMLKEIKRTLKPGGRFVAVDHAVPPHFRFLFQGTADHRAHEFGIQEDLVSFARWQTYFTAADLPTSALNVYDNPAYQENPYFRIAGKFLAFWPTPLKWRLFPVGLFVDYQKPIAAH